MSQSHFLISHSTTSSSNDVLADFAGRLEHLDLKKKTIGIPSDWKVEEKLILDMVKARIAETK